MASRSGNPMRSPALRPRRSRECRRMETPMERTQLASARLVGETGEQLPKGLRLNGIRISCESAHYRKAVYCFPAKIAGIDFSGRKFLPRTGSHLIDLLG